MERFNVESAAGTLEVVKLGEVTTSVNKETYSVGNVNGELCVWAPEVGVADSLVLVSDLPQNWGGEEADLDQLIAEAQELAA